MYASNLRRSQILQVQGTTDIHQQHKRNEHRKKTIYKAYKDNHAATQDAITSYFDKHEAST